MKPSIQFVKRKDGVRIAYSKFGEGQPLIYPAPWITDLSSFLEDPMINQFFAWLAQETTVILYDKHGCGQSERDRKEFDLEAELLDLETVVDQLRLEEIILFGISMAGSVSIAYTARHPDKVSHLIIYGAFANGATIAKEEVKSALISLVKASWGMGSKALADIFIPGANTEQLQAFARFQRESCTPEVAAKLLALTYSLDVTELLSGINAPTLVLHREGDKAIRIDHGRHLAAEIHNARFKVLKGSIHLPWYGESNEVIEEILKFLGKEPYRPSYEVATKIDRAGDEEVPLEGVEVVEQATILFSDIVSSTDLVTQLGDTAARDIFLQHDKIVRDQLKKLGGKELQNLGDGFMLSFESPSIAIKCACRIQKEISAALPSIRVRMGINTGEVVIREGKHPFGQAVVLASRIASRGKGEEILVSDVTKHLVSGSKLPFAEKGRFKPKGFDETIKLHEIAWKE
jgi:class 3 adenylate cyclase/pimeloyl-ACP methyl ester carboxylesterase